MAMTIRLLWKYLHYDVDQLTWRYGKTHTADEENKEISQTTANNASDSNLVFRFVITGTARLRRFLADYVTEKTEDATDKLPTEKTAWSFTFNDDVAADGHALAELMHWFVVRFSIFQWCKVFAPDQAALEKSEIDDLKKDLSRMLGGGSGTMPRKEALATESSDWAESVVIDYTNEP